MRGMHGQAPSDQRVAAVQVGGPREHLAFCPVSDRLAVVDGHRVTLWKPSPFGDGWEQQLRLSAPSGGEGTSATAVGLVAERVAALLVLEREAGIGKTGRAYSPQHVGGALG